MAYYVTFGGSDAAGRPAPAAIDVAQPGKRLELSDAIAHAHRLLTEGKEHVAINDGDGNSISGADLIACCNGEKSITPDLKAISN